MDIGAYIAPSRAFLDVYMAANFNKYTIVIGAEVGAGGKYYVPEPTNGDTIEENLIKVLELCESKGIDAQIQLHSKLTDPRYTAYTNVFTQVYPNIDFKDYPALKGFFIVDEPTWDQLEYIEANYVSWFNENYAESGHEFYVNMLGGYSSWIGHIRDANGEFIYTNNGGYIDNIATDMQKTTFYNAYVNKWLTILKKIETKNKYFSIDDYPLEDNQEGALTLPTDELPEGYERHIAETWLLTLYNAANVAKNNNFLFGAYVQACDEEGRNFRLPTKLAEIRWQAYINMAFGAKRLVYYGYDQRTGGTYMTEGGNPLDMYYFVQATNEEILKFDHVIAAFDTWLGVKTFSATNEKCVAFQNVADVELAALTGVSNVITDKDLLVGEMVDENGNHGYMLVGYDDPYNGGTTEVSMTFEGALGVIIYRNGERILSEDLVDGVFSTTISAGEGIFVIPVYAE